MPETKPDGPGERRGQAVLEFWQTMPLPAYIIDRGRNLFLANQALAATFGYQGVEAAEAALAASDFLSAHFNLEAVSELYDMLMKNGRVDGWLLCGETLDGREMALEISAGGTLRSAQGPQLTMRAIFVPPGDTRDGEAFLKKARLEAEQAEKAKNEFLANISHELRTPLNIIIGMLALAVEDESLDEEMRGNLALAKDGADRLFGILNDLIVLSSLEGGRLTSDLAQFSPQMLLQSLIRQFTATAEGKGVALKMEADARKDTVLEGGYNFIVLAM
ncbi:MAG: hypothetical protein LBV21_03585, partial [Candidatus Adiutrix sp.]|nr:hypothetical protein [Candidatus Adiutrix sp.]